MRVLLRKKSGAGQPPHYFPGKKVKELQHSKHPLPIAAAKSCYFRNRMEIRIVTSTQKSKRTVCDYDRTLLVKCRWV